MDCREWAPEKTRDLVRPSWSPGCRTTRVAMWCIVGRKQHAAVAVFSFFSAYHQSAPLFRHPRSSNGVFSAQHRVGRLVQPSGKPLGSRTDRTINSRWKVNSRSTGQYFTAGVVFYRFLSRGSSRLYCFYGFRKEISSRRTRGRGDRVCRVPLAPSDA